MDDRLQLDFALLRGRYPDLEVKDRWVRVPAYDLPAGWTPACIPVAFIIRPEYPRLSPYGIYVPHGLAFKGNTTLTNYSSSPSPQPPFEGSWGIFSWEAADWRATANPQNGHNLLNWVIGFAERFRQGA